MSYIYFLKIDSQSLDESEQIISSLNSKMDRNRSSNPQREEVRGRNSTKNKENSLSDTVYLIQNQNDVLRMKNTQLNTKIKELKMQLQRYTESIALQESDIENMKTKITNTSFRGDIQIQNQKRLLTEKITLMKSEEDILLRKIKEAREATIFQEQKVSQIQNDRKGIEVEILSLKAQNEGTKIVLNNLEEENERLRDQNQKLVSRRKINQPKQKQLSVQIEQRIRIIKNQQQQLKNLKRNETAILMTSILTILLKKKKKQYFSKVERFSLLRKIAQKKIMEMSLIRKKYTLFIKNQVIEELRSKFKPLKEQENAKRIISATHKRRLKAYIWRKWRKQTKNSQFATTRKFEFQNSLQKISQSFEKSNIFSTFNILKYFKNNPYHQNAVSKINHTWIGFMNRYKTFFFSALRSATNKYEIQKEIEISSKEQSQMLVMSLYFSAWGKVAKSRSIENKNLKRRYFKELKKLLAMKNNRKLGEMLTQTNQKLTEMDILSKNFSFLKKEATIFKMESLNEERDTLEQKKIDMQDQTHQIHLQKKDLYRQLALIKISKYLQKKVQKAFDIWRLRKQQSKVILTIMNLIESKKTFDKNFAFAKILKKRFAMLKKSINDKIQSCEFSYNYLLDENKHIKEVLDTKTHELQKTKFMGILKRICRNEKEMKLKYFYKFMRSGFKFWKFRKTCQRLDKMAERKIKVVFIWLLKQENNKIHQQNRIQSFVHEKESKMMTTLLKNSLKGFEMNRQRCKRLKRIMGGVFQRNLELDFYAAFGKIRNQQHIYYRGLIQDDIDELQGEIDKTNTEASEETMKIETLKARLEDKEQTFAERKILGLYRFFVKHIKLKIGSCIQKWRSRAKREINVLDFAKILERKSRIVLKNKFLYTINKKNEDDYLREFQEKMKKFQSQYDKMTQNQQNFLKENEESSAKMKGQNQFNKKEGQMFEKKTDFMTNIQLKSFKKARSKKMLKVYFKQWRNQTDIFIQKWDNLDKQFTFRILKEAFTSFSKEMKEELFNLRIRTNLEKIYVKTYRFNLGIGFRCWKYVLLEKHIQLWTQQERKQMKRFEGLQKKYKYAIGLHDSQVTYRQYDPTIRGLWNRWRQYTQHKIFNNNKKLILEKWLFRGYGSEFLRLVKKKVNKKIAFKQKYNKFIKKWQQLRLRAFIEEISQNKHRRNSIDRLFISKFCPFMMHKTLQDVLTRIKNFGNNQIIRKKQDKTKRIQQVIETFEKKRKGILNFYMRKWRRNEYEMRIAKNLMRKITRNAMNWRVKDLFYTWKLEAQAKRVKQVHEEQGEVKKRKIEINRLKIFLQDFKKEKGLLLEDDAGKFVLSPRFQEKKDLQIKKDNNMRYKFISRMILAMNGYSAPAKAWNNLKVYMLVREKIKKHARMVKNNLRKPELAYAFKIWHKASLDFNKMFDTMQRKGLIKILNRQKDKMEMEYSKKLSLQEKIHDEMKFHKLLSYHEDRKEKLCVHLLLKNVRKVKLYSLLTWKDRVRELKETELESLEDQGNNKINSLEEEVNQLEETERELKENNIKLEQAVQEALDIAEMVKRITEERDLLSKLILEKQLTCESLQEENEELNAKLYQAQKEAMNLLILSGEKLSL